MSIPLWSIWAVKRLLNSVVSRRSLVKLAVTGFFTILATRKASAEPLDRPSTTEVLPHLPPQLPPPALSFTKSPATIQPRLNLTIKRDLTRALLVFGAHQSRPQLASAIQPLGLVLEDFLDQCGKKLADPLRLVAHTPTQFWIRSLDCQKEITQQTLVRLIQILGQDLAWVGPVYKDPVALGRGAFTCAMPNQLLIKLRTGVTLEQAQSFADDLSHFGFKEDSGRPLGRTKFRRHRIRKNSPRTAYELRDTYLSQPWNQIIEQVLFSYLPMLSALATTMPRDALYRPNSSGYTGQWNMWRIEAGFDPSALCVQHPGFESGWDVTRGSDSVVIWMIDVGWDFEHPDLRFYSQGMDFRQSHTEILGPPPRDISSIANPLYKPLGDHGTWCAGVLAASIDSPGTPCNTQSDGRGVAGLAGGCKFFPLAVQDSPTADEFADAIEYAIDHMTLSSAATAKIMSISMGRPWTSDGFPEGWYNYDLLIEPVLDDALCAGMVICAASGNSAHNSWGTSIWYPASKDGVLACGASDQSDLRAHDASWGSCYGPGLSVVAPGVSIPTTAPGSTYIFTFGQTSAAVPHVAGLAALLLSFKPCLSGKDVKDTIEQTAHRVNMNTYSYQPRPNGRWNPEVGYGRINVRAALAFVRSRCRINPIGDQPDIAERDIP